MTRTSNSDAARRFGKNQTKPIALVVDDEITNREFLRVFLEDDGYSVIEAENGLEAINAFQANPPDIIFMDVIMPVMDGYEAVTQIQKQAEAQFIPILFLTALTDENALAKCIEVGGHDFLSKPVSTTVLKAKVRSMERIRKLHLEMMRLYGQMKMDQEMAETVFNGAVVADNIKLDCIQTILRPAEQFSGDVLLTAHAPSSDTHILLGDFTGHGLAAALGALPASEVFRAMTAKGFTPHQIIAGINKKLYTLLPTGMFFAVQFISISKNLEYVKVINCGMPDVLLLDGTTGQIKQRISSNSLPLGIAPDIEYQDLFDRIDITLGDRILLVSDGVTEARNSENTYFGRERFESAIQHHEAGDTALASVAKALALFCQDAPQDDDISMAEIPCIPDVLPNWSDKETPADTTKSDASRQNSQQSEPDNSELSADPLEFSITLPGRRLCNSDPIPLLINHIQEMEGLQKHRRLLFTLLTELYINALDHGLLKLDSSMKNTHEGFSEYFSEREKRLGMLNEGFIRIRIETRNSSSGGKMLIRVEDSGIGFDMSRLDSNETPNIEKLSGRGIPLLNSLCESVHYEEPGNKVEVIYSWTKD
ncbi:MAG: fused response regulator/phosphatase [Sedimenticola sp.]|nr:fused response regulator/phosphatase [Sedimenticola sp.]